MKCGGATVVGVNLGSCRARCNKTSSIHVDGSGPALENGNDAGFVKWTEDAFQLW
jgi:hypothetical protein